MTDSAPTASGEGHAAFISYSHRYGDWVRVLHENLEKSLDHAGRPGQVFCDQVDLGPGHSWVGQLQAGLATSRHLDVLRRQLVDILTSIVRLKADRHAVAGGLGLERRALDGYPSFDCAAAAALVLATGDDDPLAAARRVIAVVAEVFDDQTERVRELTPLGEEIEREIERRRDDGPERGLLATWLRRVELRRGRRVLGYPRHDRLSRRLRCRTSRAARGLAPEAVRGRGRRGSDRELADEQPLEAQRHHGVAA